MDATLMLYLMRAGAPNDELLSAKGVDQLMAVAERHQIAIEGDIAAKIGAVSGVREEPPIQRDTRPRMDADALPEQPRPSPALSRARAWRYTTPQDGGSVASPAGVPTGEEAAEEAAAPASSADTAAREVGVYEGERNASGLREGVGVCTYDNGIVYDGSWVSNLPHGEGRVTYPSGDVFEGTFELGVRWGVGVTTFADGRLEVARYIAGENDRKETAFFSSNRRSAWRILRNGEEVEEVSVEEAERIAERLGAPIKSRYAPTTARTARSAASTPSGSPGEAAP